MQCDANAVLFLVASFLACAVVGFLLRASDSERRQSFGAGYTSWFMRALYAPFWSWSGVLVCITALALFFGVLVLPGYLFGYHPTCGAEYNLRKVVFVSGILVGWLLRYLVWKFYLWQK